MIPCPYCLRSFATANSLRDHVRSKRRSSAAHGLDDTGRPRNRQEITDAIAWVEEHTHLSDAVTIIERWVPAKEGEYAPFLFRAAGTDRYIAMRLESRRETECQRVKPPNQ